MAHEEAASASVQERPREAGISLTVWRAIAGRRVAGRQNHQTGIQLQAGDFTGGQVTVITSGVVWRRRENEAGLQPTRHFACKHGVGSESKDAELIQLLRAQTILSRISADKNASSVAADRLGKPRQLFAGFRQRRQTLQITLIGALRALGAPHLNASHTLRLRRTKNGIADPKKPIWRGGVPGALSQ
jgi:hypothetical protein